MQVFTPLDVIPLWLLFIATFTAILVAFEGGYRLEQARRARSGQETEAPVVGMVGAVLGLLAFVLAFTFGIAESRFDARRTVLLDEVNAVGTAYLRAEMLPEPHRSEVQRLLRDYVDVRITSVQDGSAESIVQGVRRSEELHGLLWREAVAAAALDPRSVPIGLFVQALNEVIDLHTKRVTLGVRTRIPMPIWIMLFSVAALSFATMGYHAGLVGTSRSPAVLVVALTFASVIWLIADLDRPRQGFLQISQQPMIELRNSMAAPAR